MRSANRHTLEESSKRLDALSQEIWESGFTVQTLAALNIISYRRSIKAQHYLNEYYKRNSQVCRKDLQILRLRELSVENVLE